VATAGVLTGQVLSSPDRSASAPVVEHALEQRGDQSGARANESNTGGEMVNRHRFGRAHRVAVGLAAAAIAAVGLGVAALPAGAAPAVSLKLNANQDQASGQFQVPDAIRVPDGNKRIAEMSAQGVQTYQCTNGAFTFLQPDAILQEDGRAQVLHTAGPVWTSVIDGSSVTGAVVAVSPVQDAIPQVLLSGIAHRGPGLLAAVTFIQRLDTTGGLSPTGACTTGTTVSVPYTADYAFWIKA
jgi:hypothetical protein